MHVYMAMLVKLGYIDNILRLKRNLIPRGCEGTEMCKTKDHVHHVTSRSAQKTLLLPFPSPSLPSVPFTCVLARLCLSPVWSLPLPPPLSSSMAAQWTRLSTSSLETTAGPMGTETSTSSTRPRMASQKKGLAPAARRARAIWMVPSGRPTGLRTAHFLVSQKHH